MIWEWELRILIQADPRSEKRKVLQIQPAFWEECMRELNIVDMDRILWKNLQNMPEFRYGMV